MDNLGEHILFLEYFANEVDNNIQNHLVSELMARYADMSKQLEEKNHMLNEYNNHLEKLVQEKVKEISDSQVATIHALVKSAESRDEETGAHIERTARYCRLIAEKLREAGKYKDLINDEYTENIEMAAPLHDIGKVGIPDSILLKPGRLTDDEFETMKSHVIKGYGTLASVDSLYHENAFLRLGMEISRYHHEKWDGSGYMSELSRDEIPLSARIMALSDVYDALRTKRVYKPAFSHEKTVSLIKEGRDKHFDPELVDLFIEHSLLFDEIFEELSNN